MTAQNEPSASTLEPLLRKLQYRQTLSPEDRAAVLALPHNTKQVEQHSHIVREGLIRGIPACYYRGLQSVSKSAGRAKDRSWRFT